MARVVGSSEGGASVAGSDLRTRGALEVAGSASIAASSSYSGSRSRCPFGDRIVGAALSAVWRMPDSAGEATAMSGDTRGPARAARVSSHTLPTRTPASSAGGDPGALDVAPVTRDTVLALGRCLMPSA